MRTSKPQAPRGARAARSTKSAGTTKPTRTKARAPGPCCQHRDADLEHCHEILVEHEDGRIECLGLDCGGRRVLHRHVIPCRELQPPGSCCGRGR